MAQTLEEQFKAEQNKDNTGFIEIGENPFKEGAEKNVVAPTVGGDGEQKEFKEITLKFPKGLVGDEFTGKDGQVYRGSDFLFGRPCVLDGDRRSTEHKLDLGHG